MTKKRPLKKRRGRRGRAVEHGAVVLFEDPGGTMQERFAWARGLVRALGYPCLLCEDPEPRTTGCFIPDPDEQFTGPMVALRQGKTRTIWYALCEDCSTLEDAAERVEARMRANAGAA